jgi:hypothetical protein
LRAPFKTSRHRLSLKGEVDRFLAGEIDLAPTQLAALRAYMRRFIVSRAEAVLTLEKAIDSLEGRESFREWFAAARLHDFDPTS